MTIQYEFPSLAVAGPPPPPAPVDVGEGLPRAETADCTCPEFCERDHGNE